MTKIFLHSKTVQSIELSGTTLYYAVMTLEELKAYLLLIAPGLRRTYVVYTHAEQPDIRVWSRAASPEDLQNSIFDQLIVETVLLTSETGDIRQSVHVK